MKSILGESVPVDGPKCLRQAAFARATAIRGTRCAPREAGPKARCLAMPCRQRQVLEPTQEGPALSRIASTIDAGLKWSRCGRSISNARLRGPL